MITLKKDDVVMEVATELQASVFLRHGYKRVEAAPAVKEETIPEEKPVVEQKPSEQKPLRRGRRSSGGSK